MHACDDDAVFALHDGSEGFGAAEEGDACGGGGVVGDIAAGFDGGGVDDGGGTEDTFCGVWAEEFETGLLEAFGFDGGAAVGAADLVAEVEEESGDAAHAAAGDADEVNAAGFAGVCGAEEVLIHDGVEATWGGGGVKRWCERDQWRRSGEG